MWINNLIWATMQHYWLSARLCVWVWLPEAGSLEISFWNALWKQAWRWSSELCISLWGCTVWTTCLCSCMSDAVTVHRPLMVCDSKLCWSECQPDVGERMNMRTRCPLSSLISHGLMIATSGHIGHIAHCAILKLTVQLCKKNTIDFVIRYCFIAFISKLLLYMLLLFSKNISRIRFIWNIIIFIYFSALAIFFLFKEWL